MSKTQQIVRAAIIVALAVVFQSLRYFIGANPFSTYIISSLVNLCLVVAVFHTGLGGGIAVALVAPLIALAQGFALAPMVAPIMLGNLSLVLIVYAAKRMRAYWFSYVGAPLKYLIIAGGMALMLSSAAETFVAALTAQVVQLITAVIGITVAVPVNLALGAQQKKAQEKSRRD